MKTFQSLENNGTLIISNQIDRPHQGTLVGDHDGKLYLGKGIVRPQLVNPINGVVEEEQCVADLAFDKSTADLSEVEFYPLNVVSDQKCRLNAQAIYFSAKDPAAFIEEDNKRFENLNAFDFMSKEATRKIKAGVPPALLIETAAVWKMYSQYEVRGIRSLVLASELVPQYDVRKINLGATEAEKLALAWDQANDDIPCFMLLVKTAENLAKQLGCSINDLYAKPFLIHRDPALPDGTSLTPMLFAGVLAWDNNCRINEGIILRPDNKYWKCMGGDFDGDYAVCIEPTETLRPNKAVARTDYVIAGKKYPTDNIIDHMVQDAEDSILQLLGPVILASTRLIERGLLDNETAAIAAGVAQGSVSAKKHPVDSEAVNTEANFIFNKVRDGSDNGNKPYISDYINTLNNTKELKNKVEAWEDLVKHLSTWEEDGTSIELALCKRIRLLDQLFKDIEFFRHMEKVSLPNFIQDNARVLCSEVAKDLIKELTKQYLSEIKSLNEEVYTEDENAAQEYREAMLDTVRILRTKFELAAVTGIIDDIKVPLLDAQYALVGYAPAKVAARNVPAEVFEALGKNTKRIIINVFGHDWENKAYSVEDITPIYSNKNEYDLFSRDIKEVNLAVISKAKNSTRVVLEVCQ